MKIKRFNESNELDPYSEENWGDEKRIFPPSCCKG
jgi:hypothetical protein